MLTEEAIHDCNRRRSLARAPEMAAHLVVLPAMAWFAAGGAQAIQAALAQVLPAGLAGSLDFVVLIVGLVFLPSWLSNWIARQFTLHCPWCLQEIGASGHAILSTRACPKCDQRILEDGRLHRHAAYKRAQQISFRTVLARQLWIAVAAACAGPPSAVLFPEFYDEYHFFFFAPAFVGVVAGGYSMFRTGDPRYALSFAASMILLGVNLAAYQGV